MGSATTPTSSTDAPGRCRPGRPQDQTPADAPAAAQTGALPHRLDLYSFYGPKTVTGTFGIALLSKYPLRNPRTFFLYSSGEQTAGIAAQVEASGRTFNIYVTHLGNGGPLIQQQQFLADIDSKANVIALGDFNFEPDSEQYMLTTGLLADAWLEKWPSGIDDSGYNPADRIDHIFISPELRVLEPGT
jgi:endonuclease/exonuclease/phosphatase family metal-dependent hydrolase